MASKPQSIVRVSSRKAYLSKAAHANLSDLLGQLTWLWNRGARRDIALSVRVYRCTGCGLVMDRDVNAAKNVLRRAIGPPPGGTSPGRAEREDERLKVAASA